MFCIHKKDTTIEGKKKYYKIWYVTSEGISLSTEAQWIEDAKTEVKYLRSIFCNIISITGFYK